EPGPVGPVGADCRGEPGGFVQGARRRVGGKRAGAAGVSREAIEKRREGVVQCDSSAAPWLRAAWWPCDPTAPESDSGGPSRSERGRSARSPKRTPPGVSRAAVGGNDPTEI